MKHRIGGGMTGLGNNAEVHLSNTGKRNKPFEQAVLDAYFTKDGEVEGGVDYESTKDYFTIGIEPSYQGDPLKIISIHRNKKDSYIARGQAFGYYGTGLRVTTKKYSDYRYEAKFVKFVNEWHEKLFGGKK